MYSANYTGREEPSNSSDLNSREGGVDLTIQPAEDIAVVWCRTRAVENSLILGVVVET